MQPVPTRAANRIWLWIIALVGFVIIGPLVLCMGLAVWPLFFPPPFETVSGPESPDLLEQVHATLVYSDFNQVMKNVLPKNNHAFLFQPEGKLIAIAGPDRGGRLAYVGYETDSEHWLSIWSPSEMKRLLTRKGDPLWDMYGEEYCGKALAMSQNGKIANVVVQSKVQFYNPQAFFRAGVLEIWNPQAKAPQRFQILCLDDRIAWFPDEKRLAFTSVSVPTNHTKYIDREYESNDPPVIYVLDISTGDVQKLVTGFSPVVSGDGQSMLFQDADEKWNQMDLLTKQTKPITIAGFLRPVALVAKSIVIYWSLPTAGIRASYTKYNSPLSGPKQMQAIKIGDLSTDQFATVIPAIDPRQPISFGAG